MTPLESDNCEKVNKIDINQVEIVVDDSDLDRVEIYMLDQLGNRVEGGTFNRYEFMDVILKFYNENF